MGHLSALGTFATPLALSNLASAVGSAADQTAKLTGPYFGQPPPGLEAVLFAPGLISQMGRFEFAISFAPGRERLLIEKTVYDSIAWALTKDRARLERVIAHDADYFSFHPDGLDGVHGYAEFERGFEIWMDPRFEATRTDVRQFRCRLSASGEVAWFSAILDDCYTWEGEPGCWQDTRWTGVLEKREGQWVIVQMHFSFASDRSDQAS